MSRVSKPLTRVLLAAPAAALAACLGVTAALAATTWTVKPGGSFTAKSGTATFKDTATGSIFTCTSVSVTGTLKSGTGLSGSGVGSISAVGFTNCTSPLNLRLFLKATALPWHVNLAADNKGAVTGTISHIQIQVTNPGCAFVLDGTGATARDGSLKFRYTDSTGRLTLLRTGGNLNVYNVRSCAGLVNDNDPLALSATLTLSPKQAITSP